MDNFDKIYNLLLIGHIKIMIGQEFFYCKLQSAAQRAFFKNEINILKCKYLNDGILSLEETLKEATKRGVWDNKKEKQYKELPSKIEKMKTSIAPNGEFFARSQKKIIIQLIQNAEKILNEVSDIRNRITRQSVEQIIKEAEIKYMIYDMIYIDEHNRLFESPECVAFDKRFYDFIVAINKVMDLFTEENLRKVSRDNIWFTMYVNGAKSSSGIWGKSTTEISDEQLLLLYWTRFYENIYSDPDCPIQAIIDDDKKLDAWMEQKNNERNKERNKKTFDTSKPFVSKTPFDRREVFVMSDPESRQDVVDMNDDASKARIKMDQSIINKEGKVSDYNLRVKNLRLK